MTRPQCVLLAVALLAVAWLPLLTLALLGGAR